MQDHAKREMKTEASDQPLFSVGMLLAYVGLSLVSLIGMATGLVPQYGLRRSPLVLSCAVLSIAPLYHARYYPKRSSARRSLALFSVWSALLHLALLIPESRALVIVAGGFMITWLIWCGLGTNREQASRR